MTPDVNMALLDFHERPGREMVVENKDGSFTIIISSRLSIQGQRDAYYHTGWLKNPKKAAYNKIYKKTTFSLFDLFK